MVIEDEMNLQLLQDNYLASCYHHSRVNDFIPFPLNVWMKQVDRTELYVYKAQITKKEVYTLRYCISLTEVSSGSPAVNISAKSVMKRFPCRRKIRYASSQHWRNLQLMQANHKSMISEWK